MPDTEATEVRMVQAQAVSDPIAPDDELQEPLDLQEAVAFRLGRWLAETGEARTKERTVAGREIALARTAAQEAQMWLARALFIRNHGLDPVEPRVTSSPADQPHLRD